MRAWRITNRRGGGRPLLWAALAAAATLAAGDVSASLFRKPAGRSGAGRGGKEAQAQQLRSQTERGRVAFQPMAARGGVLRSGGHTGWTLGSLPVRFEKQATVVDQARGGRRALPADGREVYLIGQVRKGVFVVYMGSLLEDTPPAGPSLSLGNQTMEEVLAEAGFAGLSEDQVPK